MLVANVASRFAQSWRCSSSSEPPLMVDPLSFHSAGGDQGAAQTFAPRAAAFLAVPSSVVVPSGLIWMRSSDSPIPVSVEKKRSASASEMFDAVQALEAPNPSIRWYLWVRSSCAGPGGGGGVRSVESKQPAPAAAPIATSVTSAARCVLPSKVIRKAIVTGRPRKAPPGHQVRAKPLKRDLLLAGVLAHQREAPAHVDLELV